MLFHTLPLRADVVSTTNPLISFQFLAPHVDASTQAWQTRS